MLADDVLGLTEASENREGCLLRPVDRRHDRPDARAHERRARSRRWCSPTPRTRSRPRRSKQWEDRIAIAEVEGHGGAGRLDHGALVHRAVTATALAGSKKIAALIANDAGRGLRRLRPGDHEAQHHRAAEGHQAAGAGDHRRAGRRRGRHASTSASTCRERSSSASRRPLTSPTSSSPRPFNRGLREFL